MNFAATLVGALLAALFGIISAKVLDYMRMKQDEKSASAVIATELSRIIYWFDKLLIYKDEDRPFEVWGMFLPINSLGQYRAIMKKVLSEKEFKDLEDAYIRFSTLDREMQGVVQAWSASAQELPKGPAKRWGQVFWVSVHADETKKAVERLRVLLKKLEDI